jgi:hypothetical protein
VAWCVIGNMLSGHAVLCRMAEWLSLHGIHPATIGSCVSLPGSVAVIPGHKTGEEEPWSGVAQVLDRILLLLGHRENEWIVRADRGWVRFPLVKICRDCEEHAPLRVWKDQTDSRTMGNGWRSCCRYEAGGQKTGHQWSGWAHVWHEQTRETSVRVWWMHDDEDR